MGTLPITEVINVSVLEAGAGAGNYNTSNIGLFTEEVFDPDTFGALGYKIYSGATAVGVDFGTASKTYKMAQSIFSQKPNILAGSGRLIVMPFISELQSLSFSATPASGTFIINFGGGSTAAINWNDTAAQIQTKLRAVTGLSQATVTGAIPAGLSVTFNGVYGDVSLLTITSNTLMTSVPAAVSVTVAQVTAGETYLNAIIRTSSLVQYFGLMATQIFAQQPMLDAAAQIQTLNKIGFFVSQDPASVATGGLLDLLRSGGFTQSRGLFYGDLTAQDALNFMASYASRALCVDFTGSNTTLTMNLKDLATVQPDGTMSETLFALCKAAGADIYASIQGIPKSFSFGANKFFDQVYNQQWFVGALAIAAFNYYAETTTKIPQTESGMDGFKGAIRQICKQGVKNQYLAPGTWSSSDTFGVLADFLANIIQTGFYIYSAPISDQVQADREARIAPLCQVAAKEAGALQSGNIQVNVNA